MGLVGHTGVSFGPHLFFALLEDGRAVDPRPFLEAPLCNGTTTHQRMPAEIVAAGEEPPPTRHFYLLSDFPAGSSQLGRVAGQPVKAAALPTTSCPPLAIPHREKSACEVGGLTFRRETIGSLPPLSQS